MVEVIVTVELLMVLILLVKILKIFPTSHFKKIKLSFLIFNLTIEK